MSLRSSERVPCLLLALCACAGAQPSVEVVPVISRVLERTVRLPGELLPYQQVPLQARVAGHVREVRVDRGSAVRRGQVLVTLAAPELAARQAEAEAKVQAGEAQRAEADARLQAAQATLERLQAAAATAGAIAGNELVQAEKTVQAARAALRAQEGSIGAAKAAVAAQRELQQYLTLTAPFDAVVTERLVHPGAVVGPGSGMTEPLLRLEQVSRLRLVVAVPEADVGGIARGVRVEFSVPAYPEQTFTGVVSRVARSLDARTRTMSVEADVTNARGVLSPGMYPQVQWPVRTGTAALLVPPTAVVTTTERTFVIRVRNGRAEWVNVKRGAPSGDLVVVTGPLQAGDTLVRRGSDELRNGTAVNASRR